ncbi:MAG TPA: SufS family cysteine desulfurase [Candidatus Saccharimonadia bacterium]|nr:SufS family cysteine desulfurase [Candidatus Saccharimonadia bacterium]
MSKFKSDFPIFSNHPKLVYLDSAATAQKPQTVIDAVSRVYGKMNANIHRGIYDLSQEATTAFEDVRALTAKFIGASEAREVVFTSGTTESINLVAYGWARKYLRAGDIIVTSEMEHHSNIVPWQRLRDEIGVRLEFLPVGEDFRLDLQAADQLDMKRVKLLALTQASNVLGTVNPVVQIVEHFRGRGARPKVLVDAAQSVAHLPIDVRALDVDFLAFSSHKLFGPSGVGVLWARKELLAEMDPLLVGSHMIATVTKAGATWAEAPDKFEPGTRNIEGVIGLGAAINYLEKAGMRAMAASERVLTEYALARLREIRHVTLLGPDTAVGRIGVFSLVMRGVHAHDVAEVLNREHVAVRAGHHCAQPLMHRLGVSGTVRASVQLYNTEADIDALVEGLERVKRTFKV